MAASPVSIDASLAALTASSATNSAAVSKRSVTTLSRVNDDDAGSKLVTGQGVDGAGGRQVRGDMRGETQPQGDSEPQRVVWMCTTRCVRACFLQHVLACVCAHIPVFTPGDMKNKRFEARVHDQFETDARNHSLMPSMLPQLLPVPGTHARTAQVCDKRQGSLESINRLLEP